MNGISIWITGLPGSGKSAIADELARRRPGFVVLRMDEMRRVVTPEPSYSEVEREIIYRSLVFLAEKLTELGHDIIIDATGNLRRWRELARDRISGYMEIYLKCPLEICVKRENERRETRNAPKEIYEKAARGWPVPGVGAPYEEPIDPDVVIEADKVTVTEAAEIIEKAIKAKISTSSKRV